MHRPPSPNYKFIKTRKAAPDEYFFGTLAVHFENHRSEEGLVAFACLWNHAGLVDLMAHAGSLLRKRIVLCIYHCDLFSQYLSHAEAEDARRVLEANRRKRSTSGKARARPVQDEDQASVVAQTLSCLVQKCALMHLRAINTGKTWGSS